MLKIYSVGSNKRSGFEAMAAAQAAENRHMRLDLVFRKRDITSISTWI